MRCEVVAVGTGLPLGQIVDTNSSRLGEQPALAGIDSRFQTRIGDHHAHITARDAEAAAALLAGEEARLRSCLGDLVFATDGDTIRTSASPPRKARAPSRYASPGSACAREYAVISLLDLLRLGPGG